MFGSNDRKMTKPMVDEDAITRAACYVLGVAFAHGDITVPAVEYAVILASIAEEIAERAVSDGVSAGSETVKNS